ncbi:uncharacterized protein LOC128325284 isoform X2 [Hemicordylus capensis]|uniref:uncharacterized protein LOC128325284 isoform X2 n=1 Tax=Hemicordylus capensis TaxID=884348 RepID=UPI002304A476|nr:uncharacterized protein LOC128325284 isoform X2 [Hemicordylus capensis]
MPLISCSVVSGSSNGRRAHSGLPATPPQSLCSPVPFFPWLEGGLWSTFLCQSAVWWRLGAAKAADLLWRRRESMPSSASASAVPSYLSPATNNRETGIPTTPTRLRTYTPLPIHSMTRYGVLCTVSLLVETGRNGTLADNEWFHVDVKQHQRQYGALMDTIGKFRFGRTTVSKRHHLESARESES